MNRISRTTLTFLPFALLAACGTPESKFRQYDGPPVTQILVNKGERRMYLMNGGTVLKSYDVGLGNEPVGSKRFDGDGKTPEGVYFIDRFNPNSAYLRIGQEGVVDRRFHDGGGHGIDADSVGCQFNGEVAHHGVNPGIGCGISR